MKAVGKFHKEAIPVTADVVGLLRLFIRRVLGTTQFTCQEKNFFSCHICHENLAQHSRVNRQTDRSKGNEAAFSYNWTAYYKTTDYRQVTDHQPTSRSSNDHQPTEKCSTNSPTTSNWSPTKRWWQVFHGPTNHRLTYPPTLLQLTNNALTHQSYFNRVTIRPIISITNFSSSFWMGTIYYWIHKVIYKMIDRKERW